MRHHRGASPIGNVVPALPSWPLLLRAIREAGSVTQDGWGARIGVSRRTVQRWERGELPPDTAAEAGIAAYCAEKGLFRPLRGAAARCKGLR
jgi:DNA-binding XRE family transcriptional regulator